MEAGVRVPRRLRKRSLVYVALRTLAMGGVNALGHAQLAHETMLSRSGSVPSEYLLRCGRPVPHSSLWIGAYVDDLLVGERAPLESVNTGGTERGSSTVRAIEDSYARARAQVKASRNADGVSEAVVWGSVVNGLEGWVGIPPEKVLRLQWLTLEFLQVGDTDYVTLAALLGTWNPVLLHARCAMCVLDGSCRFAASISKDTEMHRVPDEVFEEVLMLAILAPALWTDLRTPVSNQLYMTDASLWRAGITKAEIPSGLATDLWRYSDLRGRHSWLAPLHVKTAEEKEHWLSPVEACFAALVSHLEHRSVISYPFQGGPYHA